MYRLPRNHIRTAIIAFRYPTPLRPRKGALRALSLYLSEQREEDAQHGGEAVEVLVRDEADDDVGPGFAPGPGFAGGVGGEEVELRVVEEGVVVRGFEAAKGFVEGDVNVVFCGGVSGFG